MHDSNGQLTFDLTRARSGNSLNPFIDQAATTAATGTSPSATATSSESDNNDSSENGGANGNSSQMTAEAMKKDVTGNATIS